ncbi:MAG: M28 family peptidase [Planctomycetota bacterium]|nr:MAG: M28 family peptidase [Planctomycetota bacterium]
MIHLVLLCAQQDPVPTAAELEAHVQLLASDALQGRRSGTLGADQAADYLAGVLASAGLVPAGEADNWFQSFEIELPAQPGSCFLDLGAAGRWEDVGTLALSASRTIQGPLWSVGYGLDGSHKPELVRGAVLLLRRYSAAGPSAGPGQGGDLRAKIRAAAEAGAAAVVLGTHPEDLARGGEAAIPFDAAPGSMPIPVLTVSPEQFTRLERMLAAAPALPATVGAEVLRPTARTRNVLGLLPGASDEVIVLGAHYDHLGFGGPHSLAPGTHEIHNGADDNASGTALLLELAESMAQRGRPPGRSLLFALWSGEEEGLLGSDHWVKHPTIAWERVVCNLNFDMVGRLQEGRIIVGAVETAAAFGPALERARPGQDLEFSLAGAALPGGGGSDHMSFHQAGVAALFFFSGMHSDYHKPGDDWHKLDYARMQILAEAAGRLVLDLGNVPREQFAYMAPPPADPHQGLALSGERASMGTIPDYGANPEGGGMQLAGVSPGGAAERAGLRGGDVIKKLGAVAVGDIYDFMDALGRYKPGDAVDVVVLRDGALHTLPVTLGGRREVQ